MSRHGSNYDTLRKYIKEFDLDTSIIEENRKKLQLSQLRILHNSNQLSLEDIISGTYSQKYRSSALRDRLIKNGYKEHRCECCGLTTWLNGPIPLHLHHKDGNHDNNMLDNLELLCPNCHSLTDNYGSKNKKNKEQKHQKHQKHQKDQINKKDLCPICNINYKDKNAEMCLDCYKEKRNKRMKDIDRETLKNEIRIYPMTSVAEIHGVTDNAVRKWCKKYNLPHKSREIKKISDEDWSKI